METKIVRYETIMVETIKKDEQYNKLVVNGKYKIPEKRENLWEVFQVGAEVKLGFGNYMNQDFIATAEQTGKHIPLVEAAKKLGAVPVDEIRVDKDVYKPTVQPMPQAPQSTTKPIKQESDSRTRSMAVAYAKDAWVNGVIAFADIKEVADRFLLYIETGL